MMQLNLSKNFFKKFRQKRYTVTFLRKIISEVSKKGRRSCSPPLEMLSHFLSLPPFFRKGNFALCGGRQGTLSP